MEEEFPTNIFTTNDLQRQMDAIKEYTKSFKEEHADIFKDDTDDSYIRFIWNSFPKMEKGKSKISFDIQFNDKLPLDIRNKFEDYLNQFKDT